MDMFMFTEFNCQSATLMKNIPLYSIVFMQYFILFLMLALSAHGLVLSVFVMKCMLKLPYPRYSKSLTSQLVLNFLNRSFGQKKHVHCSLQGKWFSS